MQEIEDIHRSNIRVDGNINLHESLGKSHVSLPFFGGRNILRTRLALLTPAGSGDHHCVWLFVGSCYAGWLGPCWLVMKGASLGIIWGFPKMGVPLNRPFLDGIVPYKYHPFWASPISGNPQISGYICSFILQSYQSFGGSNMIKNSPYLCRRGSRSTKS